MPDNPYWSYRNYLKIYDSIIVELCIIYTLIVFLIKPFIDKIINSCNISL